MKSILAGALALSVMLAPVAVADDSTAFRTPAPQAFSSEDLQRYGLDAERADRAAALQDQGYQLMVLTPAEADQYTAGLTDNELLLIAILIGVVVIAVSVS